jgi:hypothetical protein
MIPFLSTAHPSNGYSQEQRHIDLEPDCRRGSLTFQTPCGGTLILWPLQVPRPTLRLPPRSPTDRQGTDLLTSQLMLWVSSWKLKESPEQVDTVRSAVSRGAPSAPARSAQDRRPRDSTPYLSRGPCHAMFCSYFIYRLTARNSSARLVHAIFGVTVVCWKPNFGVPGL